MKFKGFKNYNIGDWLLQCTIGMYACSVIMGLAIGNFDFADKIIIYLIPMALISFGISMIIDKENSHKHSEAKREESE